MRTAAGPCLLGIASQPENDIELRQFINNPVALNIFALALLVNYVTSSVVNTIGSRLSNVDLYCEMKSSYSENYTCEVFSMKQVKRIVSVGGSNLNGKTYSDVDVLEFYKIEVRELPDGIGDVFPKLSKLEISHAQLQSISRSNFKEMAKLTVLRITNNKLSSIAEETFWDLEHLRELNLMANLLKELPAKLLMNMISLRTFDAERNSITHLAGVFFANNRKLELIQLSENPFKKIDAQFSMFDDLWGVFLHFCGCIDDSVLIYNDSNDTRIMKIEEFNRKLEEKC